MNNKEKYILSFDLGTSSVRAFLFDSKARQVAIAQEKFTQHFPKPGWVEHDPEEIWEKLISVAKKAIKDARISVAEIITSSITNQRETSVIWDKKTGKPVYNAIVWQDTRTSNICDELVENGYKDLIHKKTGLVVNSYFSATKIKWLTENLIKPQNLNIDDLLFGTIDSWVLWKLTNGKVHATDYSNASRTMLFNIETLKWDEELLEILDIPKNILPEVHNSSHDFGEIDKSIFGKPIPITAILGDQQASLFGQCCFEEGSAKVTYGTGCFILSNIGERPIYSDSGLLTTIAWGIDGKITYALEGSVFDCASVINWLVDNMGFVASYKELDKLVKESNPDSEVKFLPSFSGLGAPYWKMDLDAEICGLGRKSNKADIARAAMEAICFQVREILDLMQKENGKTLKYINTDGGVSNSNFMMQFQSDILQNIVRRKQNKEMTILGATYLAGMKFDLWSYDELKKLENYEVFSPRIDKSKAEKIFAEWKNFINSKIK